MTEPTETQWGDEEPAAPKKKLLPTWAWIGCGGCAVFLLVIALAVVWVVGQVREGLDPEVQWPKVSELVEYDEEAPDRYTILKMPLVDQYTFVDEETHIQLQLMHLTGESGDEAHLGLFEGDEFLLPEKQAGMEFEDLGREIINVQGRDLTVQHIRMNLGFWKKFMPEKARQEVDDALGAIAFVDMTLVEGDCIYWQVTRPGATEKVTAGELNEILELWHIGPDRDHADHDHGAATDERDR